MISIAVTLMRALPSAHAFHLGNRRMRPFTILCIADRRSAEECHCRNYNKYWRNLLHLSVFTGLIMLSIEHGRPYHGVTGGPAACYCKQGPGAIVPSLGQANCYGLF